MGVKRLKQILLWEDVGVYKEEREMNKLLSTLIIIIIR